MWWIVKLSNFNNFHALKTAKEKIIPKKNIWQNTLLIG